MASSPPVSAPPVATCVAAGVTPDDGCGVAVAALVDQDAGGARRRCSSSSLAVMWFVFARDLPSVDKLQHL